MIEFQHKRGGGRIVGHKGGKGGGGSARQPVEAPDSLHSTAFAKVLDLISEGPIVGPVHGLGSMGRDVYLDGTPVQNENGTLNFDGVKLDFRAGTQDQSYIQGFPAAEAGQAVGVEVRDDTPWTQFISDTALSAVRVTVGFQGLSRANSENGDINGYRIAYVIEVSTDGGPYQVAINTAVSGKTTQLYERSHRVDLPDASTGWTVRVRRITPNQNSSLISDTMLVQSYTTIVDAKLKYPMSALFGVQVDASQFRSVPQRAYHVRLRIISVPTNYNPETRQYSGTWDGTFKQAWTDNPAWIFYDLVSNTRYGAGERLTPQALSMLKWSLYPIAQYCDELVPDGLGGTEPRFRCNVYIQEDEDAARVLADLAGVFQGMVYESSGAIMASADMPSSWSYTYTNGNVRDGVFRYSGTPRRTRYTVAQVTYNDMSNFGRAKVEVYEDREAINRYGVRIIQLTAFGCTSRAQAIRVGKWAIISSRTQTDAVTFQTGLEHAVVGPGSIIRVADSFRAGRRIGGRIAQVNSASEVVLDKFVEVRNGDRLVLNLPSGVSESRVVSDSTSVWISVDSTDISVDSDEITADATSDATEVISITVSEPFSETPTPESVWTIESDELTNRLFRVQSVALKDGLFAEISAIEHNPSKYDAIDQGSKIEQPPITVIPPAVMPAPENVTITSYSVLVQGVALDNARIEWEAVEDAIAYHVQWRRDESDWIEGGRVGSTSLELENVKRGGYVARVRAINAANIPSAWSYSVLTAVEGNLEPPPALSSLVPTGIPFGIRLKWGIPAAISPIERTEIWYSASNNRNEATLMGAYPYPQNQVDQMGLAAGVQFYYWGRLVDKNGEPGPWYPAGVNAGVLGTSSTDATSILEYLTGEITETQLAQSLLDKIEGGDGAIVRVEALESELAAMYTIKTQLTVDGVPYMAGIGVGVENDEGIITSQILLAAARVAILDESSGTTVSPFVVQGGQVFINQAVIGDGWITNAMIGNVIQSDNYVPNSTGWRIDKTGGFEMNGSLPGGGRVTVTNQAVSVFDDNNIERVRMGYLA